METTANPQPLTRIRKLPPHIAERIAAGEMIERPASVVKELVENSLDAGCTEVCVALEDGGKGLIEVTDNGMGMLPEDLQTSVERHATSKLSTLDDLERISTLGFRGEALPSIAAVSDLTILSRAKDSNSAYEFSLGDLAVRQIEQPKPKRVTHGQFIDSPHGTQIRAVGLFSQVPARLKFLKAQASEVSQVREWLERLALAYPQVGFKLTSSDRTVLSFRPQSEEERVRAVLSDGEDFPLIQVENDQDGFRDLGLKARLYWLQGSSSPNSRSLVQVVNSRAVRDKLLQQALLSPFRQALMPGQFPAVALFIQVNPAAIDVNMHPTKTEIRFLDSRKVFQTVETMVKKAIAKHGAPRIQPPTSTPTWPPTRTNSDSQMDSVPTPSTHTPPTHTPPTHTSPNSAPYSSPYSTPSFDTPTTLTAAETASTIRPDSPAWMGGGYSRTPESGFPRRPMDGPERDPGLDTDVTPAFRESDSTPGPSKLENLDVPQPLSGARFVGSLFNTYIAYENRDELILIDQHAAHERIQYEKLRNRVPDSSAQALLIPEVIKIPKEFKDHPIDKLSDPLTVLNRHGFEVELFGEDSLVFRAIPAEWNHGKKGQTDLKIRLKNLTDRALTQYSLKNAKDTPLLDETLFESLASEACHSSVRARDVLFKEEMEELVKQLFQCEHPWNCPHGRPTVVKIPEGKIEEWFQRKI